MKNYKVIWSKSAERDLEEIVLYIAEENPLNAKKVLNKIKEKASNLSSIPHKGIIVPELKSFLIFSYHQYSTPPWRIIYRYSNTTVYVVAVIDSRRDIDELLINRALRDIN